MTSNRYGIQMPQEPQLNTNCTHLQQISTEAHLLGAQQTKFIIIYESSKTKNSTNSFETKLT